jgi:Tol biopolymer transport system component
VRSLVKALDIRGAPSWSPDGQWLVVAAYEGRGSRLYKVPLDGSAPVALVSGPPYNPFWSPSGSLILYRERLQGPNTQVKAITPDGKPSSLPEIFVNSKSEGYRFLPDGKSIIFLQGEPPAQDFWLLNLTTGARQQLTRLNSIYWMKDFDVSRDGKQILFDRVKENSDVVLIDLKR